MRILFYTSNSLSLADTTLPINCIFAIVTSVHVQVATYWIRHYLYRQNFIFEILSLKVSNCRISRWWLIWTFLQFLWVFLTVTVTGPPGALLFDRDQRSHWKNHFNCSFVWLAAWAFIAQIFCHRCQYSKISHALNWASCLEQWQH